MLKIAQDLETEIFEEIFEQANSSMTPRHTQYLYSFEYHWGEDVGKRGCGKEIWKILKEIILYHYLEEY